MNSHDSASSEADFFTFQYQVIDDPDDDQRFSRYWDLEPLQRGPQPVPDWLVTDRAAIETDLGILKTGKEADVFLLERAVPATGESCVLAAKRYRSAEHRNFHRNAGYTEGRRTKDSREARAMAKGSTFGKAVAAGQWAGAEWDSLQRCWDAGVPVPYPVQIDGTELLMELITADDGPAPRLATTRPERGLLTDWFEQLREAMSRLAAMGLAHGDLSPDGLGASAPVLDNSADSGLEPLIPAPRLVGTRPGPEMLRYLFEQLKDAMRLMAEIGFVHGDLSPYNVLVSGERLVLIDLPQMTDLVTNPNGADFLLRDCTNMCAWFRRRGLEVDEQDLFGELMAAAW